MGKRCQSYQPGSLLCRDGFPQRSFCAGNAGCTTCGAVSPMSVPLCLTEQAPPHLFDDSGNPRFAQSGAPQ